MSDRTYYTIKDGEGHWWASSDEDTGFQLYGRPTNGTATLGLIESVFGIYAEETITLQGEWLSPGEFAPFEGGPDTATFPA